jgi:uncharacterized protein (DUF1778 family)
MLPLTPKSVKMEPEIFLRLKQAADLLGYSDNQFIVESVKAVLDGAEDTMNVLPRMIVLIRTAKRHQVDAQHFNECGASSTGDAKSWWGD